LCARVPTPYVDEEVMILFEVYEEDGGIHNNLMKGGMEEAYGGKGEVRGRRIELYEEDGGIHNNQMKGRMEEAYGGKGDVRGRRIEVYKED
jgi:hypothetical protein